MSSPPVETPRHPESISKFLAECQEARGTATVSKYQHAADEGDPEAQFVIGYALLHGLQVQKHDALGLKWARLSALEGHAEAARLVGECLAKGVGGESCPVEAGYWLSRAADADIADAQSALLRHYHDGSVQFSSGPTSAQANSFVKGDCYSAPFRLWEKYTPGRPKSLPERKQLVFWCMRDANMGRSQAQCLLADYYSRRADLPNAGAESAAWARKAAEQNDSCAQLLLAEALLEGKGVLRNSAEALEWLRKSGEAGNVGAIMRLADEYIAAHVVDANPVLAYFWLNRAAATGNGEARERLDELASTLSPAQIRQAESLRLEDAKTVSPALPGSRLDVRSQPKAMGTGFFISDHGLLVTCAHVIAGCRHVRVLVDGKLIDAQVSRVDSAIDIALLKVDGKFDTLKLGDTEKAELGAEVFTVGFPNPTLQGSSAKFGQGTISALAGAMDDVKYFQVSVPVQPGNSGGPLLDDRGAVIGMIVAKLDARTAASVSGAIPEAVNYALKGSYVRAFLDGVPGVESAATFWRTSRSATDIADSAQDCCVMVLAYE